MTGTGRPRPGDAARRALRAARERAGSGPDTGEGRAPEAAETAPADGTGRTDGAEPRPGDLARAALRAAAGSAREGQGTGTAASPPVAEAAGPATNQDPDEAARPAPNAGSGSAASGRPGDAAREVVRGSGSAAGGRPGDAAREALRAARREALRAKAAEPRQERRAPARPGPAAPRTPSAPEEESQAAKAKAVQDMRRYLATAFRMPTWAETPDEPEQPAPTTPTPTEPPPQPTPAPTPSPDAPPPSPPQPDPSPTHPASSAEPSASAPRSARPSAETSASASSDPASVSGPSASAPPSARPPAESPAPAPTAPTAAPVPTVPMPPKAPPAHVSARSGSVVPYGPVTMASPRRDSELRRTFAAFAAREGGGEGAPFAGTWWGNAWVEALERGALDAGRLARGRGYADQGHVDAITVTPGLVLAYVRGSRPRPYRVQVRLRTLADEDWERFLDAAADRPEDIAALLDKELPHSLADCGVPLLPGPGDLAPRCSCPDTGHPCKHAAALCYQTARLLDADPFVLLLLRGRGEKELLDALTRRNAARAARAARERQPQTLPGVRATEVLAVRERPPLPAPLPVPPHPEQPPVYPSAPGGPDPFALDQLATDAAARAHALLGTGRDPVGELTLWQDAVRLAAARPGSGLTAATRTLYATLADAVGRTPAELARAVAAWRQGGPAGLDVLEEPWDPPAGRFDRARPLLLAADLPAFRPWRNRLTHPRGHVQLRLGRDGLWYAYESEPGQDDWWPRGTPDLDPVGALTGLGIPEDCL
ncbi:SWIM zinc finger family protein [Streptomyces cyanogenus]|uniref:SWIM-type domain-containing protein n=1 Tax=Streptomyces cyanogenus TaxID=80860 RepID=A0ABX7U029_STRCY|nr:SWIM zinc finger family protein [Streptomyces cyanogenus]QTE01878.1 hypothetical protein S1361_31395 [Streptomyces cyanogenus]